MSDLTESLKKLMDELSAGRSLEFKLSTSDPPVFASGATNQDKITAYEDDIARLMLVESIIKFAKVELMKRIDALSPMVGDALNLVLKQLPQEQQELFRQMLQSTHLKSYVSPKTEIGVEGVATATTVSEPAEIKSESAEVK
jgi:hypothetical protein